MDTLKKTLTLACAVSVLTFGVAVAQTPGNPRDRASGPHADDDGPRSDAKSKMKASMNHEKARGEGKKRAIKNAR